MFNLLHTYYPNPILFQSGPLVIHWYGFFIALAIILGLILIYYLFKAYNLKRDLIWDLSFYLVVFGIIGDRLAHVFLYDWKYYSHHLFDILKIWQGGLAIHGAIFIGILVLFIYAKKNKLSFWLLADIFTPALALGQALGRWGNYFNQEIYGLPTNLPWGIPINLVNRVKGYETFAYFQPTFLYSSILCLFIFLILFFWHKRRIKVLRNTGIIRGEGNIFLTYLFLYSIGRFLVEFIRVDIQPNLFYLRTGQWLSLLTIAAGLLLFFTRQRVKR